MPLVLGSCRVCNFYMPYKYEFTHNTKQILQLIKFVEFSRINDINKLYTDELVLVNRFFNSTRRFKNAIDRIKNVIDSEKELDNTVIIEISSIKVLHNKISDIYYLYDNYVYVRDNVNIDNSNNRRSIMNLSSKRDKIIESTDDSKQTPSDITHDIAEIYKYFNSHGMKIIYVPHLNFMTDTGEFIKNRIMLCETLEAFCKDKGDKCVYFNPLDHISNKTRKDINHYTDTDFKIVKCEIDKIVKKIDKTTNSFYKFKLYYLYKHYINVVSLI